jgi:phosphatidylglycerophosphatase A
MRLRQPIWPRFLPEAFVVGAATLGPVGRRLRAPGTWGSVAGVLFFIVALFDLSAVGLLLWSVPATYFAVAFCGEAEFRMGRTDPGEVILDEFVAMPLCYLGWPLLEAAGMPRPAWVLAGFVLFRLFDIAKPLGISRLQRLPGGWGVVVDDLAAALCACAVLHLGVFAWGALR